MAQIAPFFPPVHNPTRRLHRAKRSLESKMDEIGARSPKDKAAFHILADMVLARLNEVDRLKRAAL